MATQKKGRPSKTFGPRYGRTLKERWDNIKLEQQKKYVCPYCSRKKVKRVAVGIWTCKNCNSTFTGKAYSPLGRISLAEAKEEVIAEEIEEIKEEEIEEEEVDLKTKKEKPIENKKVT